MKIGIEGQRLFRQKKHGMDIVALELIRRLAEFDPSNQYVIFVKDDVDIACIRESATVKIKILPATSYPWWEQVILPRAAYDEGCDLLHCTSNTAPLVSRIPLITTIHDIIYLEKVALFSKGGHCLPTVRQHVPAICSSTHSPQKQKSGNCVGIRKKEHSGCTQFGR